jgi:hypothetical protein
MEAAGSSVTYVTNYTAPFPGRQRSERNVRISVIITINIDTSVTNSGQ